KIAGAWNLHTQTKMMALDFFVCFSSISALFGSPSQGSYAAANSFLDAFVHYRRSLGLAGSTINWGLWQDVGMVTRATAHYQTSIAAMGIDPISPSQGVKIFNALLADNQPQTGVIPIDWTHYINQANNGDVPPLVANIISVEASQSPTTEEIVQPQLSLIQYLQEQVADTLDYPADQIDLNQPLTTIGFDSLMFINLRNRISHTLNVDLPMSTLLQDATIESLARYIEPYLTQTNQSTDHEDLTDTWVEGEL
ncbi:MAG: beta-ketoacyl reductase, partial [Chloroflexota bacterium]